MNRPLQNRSGFALVLTLVVTALMVAAAVELIHQVYVDTALSRGFRDGQQASLLAESGLNGGIRLLQLALPKDTSSLTDRWAAPFKVEDESGTVEIATVEESGKLYLNGLVTPTGDWDDNQFTLKALQRLGQQLKIPDECWYALADWMDSNDETRSNGAEAAYYRSLKNGYLPRNGPLRSLTELSLVKGFTPQMVEQLRPFVTVYAEQAAITKVNINTAPKEVLMALDQSISQRTAERILEERRLKAFTSTGDLSTRVGTDFTGLGGRISFKGTVFRLTSVARTRDTARSVEAVVRISDNGRDLLSWQEY